MTASLKYSNTHDLSDRNEILTLKLTWWEVQIQENIHHDNKRLA